MLNTIVLNPQNRRKVRKAPMDMAIKGFHLRGYPQVVDTWANSVSFTLKVNGRARLDTIPVSPFAYMYYFDQPMYVQQNSELELDYIATAATTAAVDANPPQLVLEYEPIQQVKRYGNTMMKAFRFGPAITYQDFTLYPKYYSRVLSSFCYEDDNNAADPVINATVMNSANQFVLKYYIDSSSFVRLVDEGAFEWWRWGSFRPWNAAHGLLPEIKRRRYWPGILVRPDMPFFMERILPVAGLAAGTNIIYEFEFMDEVEYKKTMKR
jgi:hypothetical protein